MATTSGTVATYSFTQRKVIDHAMRRAGRTPQQLSSEDIQIAQDLLSLQLNEYVNAGFPLWTRVFGLLGITVGSPQVVCPAGTVDVLHCYWRIFNPYRGLATLSTGGSGSTLFTGQPGSDVTIAGSNPGVIVNFGTSTEIDTVGFLLGGSVALTAALQVKTSTDGVTFTTVQTLPSATYQPQQWTYFDLDPSVSAQYLQLVSPGASAWTLNQVNIGLANGQDIEIGPLNIDDYYNLPNKQFQATQPNSGYVDRQIAEPIIKIWPTPDLTAFYNGTVTALTRRYIQDPGLMTNDIEVPLRWYEGVVARLAVRLLDELPDAADQQAAAIRQQRRQNLDASAVKAEMLFWSEERVKAPIRFTPNLRVYTV